MPPIRAATIHDAQPIAELIVALAVKYITYEFSANGRRQFLADHTSSTMAERISGEYQYFVAEAEEGIVGVVGMRNRSHLFHLFVADPYQHQGLGRRLWEHAKAEAGNAAQFTVNSSRYAVPVYKRLGFSIAGPVQIANDVVFVPMRWRADG